MICVDRNKHWRAHGTHPPPALLPGRVRAAFSGDYLRQQQEVAVKFQGRIWTMLINTTLLGFVLSCVGREATYYTLKKGASGPLLIDSSGLKWVYNFCGLSTSWKELLSSACSRHWRKGSQEAFAFQSLPIWLIILRQPSNHIASENIPIGFLKVL